MFFYPCFRTFSTFFAAARRLFICVDEKLRPYWSSWSLRHAVQLPINLRSNFAVKISRCSHEASATEKASLHASCGVTCAEQLTFRQLGICLLLWKKDPVDLIEWNGILFLKLFSMFTLRPIVYAKHLQVVSDDWSYSYLIIIFLPLLLFPSEQKENVIIPC